MKKIDVERVRELAALGLSIGKIAREIGSTITNVRIVMGSNAIEASHGNFKGAPTERQADIIALYKSGKSLEETGQHFGMTRERVRQIVGKNGQSEGRGRIIGRRVEVAQRRARRAEERQRKEARRQAIARDYRSGVPLKEIGMKYGIQNPQALNALLRRMGEPPLRRPTLAQAMKKAYAEGKRVATNWRMEA